MNAFVTYNLPDCVEDNYYGGISTRIWFALASDFNYFNIIASEENNYENYKIIPQDGISLIGGATLKYIDVFLESGSLSEKTQGDARKLKITSSLQFSLLGITAKNLGFVSKLRNSGLVFFVPDLNGKTWVFGNRYNASYLESSSASTMQKFDEDTLVNLSYKANAELMLFQGQIVEIENTGAFTIGFSTGYNV